MTALRLSKFKGELPVMRPRDLPEGASALAQGCQFNGTSVRGIPKPVSLFTFSPRTHRIYRIPTGDYSQDNDANSWYMQFLDRNTDVLRTPVVNDSFDRYYWCNPSVGPRYLPRSKIPSAAYGGDGTGGYQGGRQGRPLGVVAPTQGPVVASVDGTQSDVDKAGDGVIQERSYVYTYVSIYGEESAPSDVATVTDYDDMTYHVSNMVLDRTNTDAQYGANAQSDNNDFSYWLGPPAVDVPIASINLYRTVAGSTAGTGDFFLVTNIPVDPSQGTEYTFDDDIAGSNIAGGTTLPSTTWIPAPTNLQGMVAMPGGFFAGWNGNTVYFSEPYHPHAWPSDYDTAVQYPIVGMGVFGQTLVVLTQGHSVTMTGTSPSTLTISTAPVALPCTSRPAIVSAPEGVYWPCRDGLMLTGPNGMADVTEKVIGRDRWQADFDPADLRGIYRSGKYLGYSPSYRYGWLLDTLNLPEGLSRIDCLGVGSDIVVDVFSGRAMLLCGGKLYEFYSSGEDYDPWHWVSRDYQFAQPLNLKAMQAHYEPVPGVEPMLAVTVEALRIGVNTDGTKGYAWTTLGTWVMDDPERVYLLPGGFLATEWRFTIDGSVELFSLDIAQTVAELRKM